MPYTITLEPARRRAVVIGAGPNDLGSTLAAMDDLASRQEFGPGFGILCDFRENGYTPGTSDSGRLADAYSARFSGRPMALIVSSLLHYGIANMITTIVRLHGRSPVAAFREVAEAESWLDAAIGRQD